MTIPFWEKQLETIKKEPYNQVQNRVEKHTTQYIERGFDDSDTWDLSKHIATWLLPRLQRYKELATGVIVIDFPLDDMIKAFDLYANKDYSDWTKEEAKAVEVGLKAFAEHYTRLWW